MKPPGRPFTFAFAIAPLLLMLTFSLATAQDSLVQQFQGNGMSNTRPFTVAGGWEIQWEATGDMFQLFLHDGAGDLVDVAANQLGPGSGASYQPRAGTYYLQVNALGRWSIDVVQVSAAPARVGDRPVEFSGNGTSNTRPFTVAGGWEIQWEATGDMFQLFLHDGAGDLVDVAANQLGPGSGASYQPRAGTYYLQVNALGRWQVRVVPVD